MWSTEIVGALTVAGIAESVFKLIMYSILTLAAMCGVTLVFVVLRAIFRLTGWDLIVGLRQIQRDHDYPPDWDRVRKVVLQRDGYQCGNCGGTDRLQVHHIVPLSSGGTNRWTNLGTLCRSCHRRLHPHMRE